VGQALVAAALKRGDDTLDLFRHAFELDAHPAAALGFGSHVVANLTGKSSHIPRGYEAQYKAQSLLALALYVASREGATDACARNLYGVLLKEHGLYTQAVAQFDAAVTILQQQHQQSDDIAARQSIVWQNMAQAMVAGGHNVEAMTVFRERLAGLPAVTAAMWCTFAQAAFQQALFVDSYQAFERTLALLGATFVLICVRFLVVVVVGFYLKKPQLCT
jgi:tetratricopeptide (TPR) repeat protein